MFTFDDDAEALAEQCFAWVTRRLREGAPLSLPPSPAQLAAALGTTITPGGIGAAAALERFDRVIAPAGIPVDSPRHAALIPAAPTIASTLFDMCVTASALVPEAWLEAAGAVHAENEALRWIADLAGLPAAAGGCFVSGGTIGNLSALAAARDAHAAGRRHVAVSREAHSSVARALHVLALDPVIVDGDERGRLTGAALEAALASAAEPPFAVVASAGNTNAGTIDDLAGVAEVARRHDLWFHVDGAYGGAGLCAPSVRPDFAGIEHVDSLIIDPHKWLFSPVDCCALLYRDPARVRATHQQTASYLDAMRPDPDAWNPADYAIHLTRRARGLPLWFSLAVHGTDAYRDAVEVVLERTRTAARHIDAAPHLELVMEPMLSVLLFRRTGWQEAQYLGWSRQLLDSGTAFVLPTRWQGEPVARFVFLHPHTTVDLFDQVIAAMA